MVFAVKAHWISCGYVKLSEAVLIHFGMPCASISWLHLKAPSTKLPNCEATDENLVISQWPQIQLCQNFQSPEAPILVAN